MARRHSALCGSTLAAPCCDVQVVAHPLVFTVSYNRAVGLVTTSMTFSTVRINGATGGPTPPQMDDQHVLKRESHMDKVVQYAKDNLPSWHNLSTKGWTKLPAREWELADDVAVPSA